MRVRSATSKLNNALFYYIPGNTSVDKNTPNILCFAKSSNVKKAIVVRLNTPIVYAHKREDCQEVSFTLFMVHPRRRPRRNAQKNG